MFKRILYDYRIIKPLSSDSSNKGLHSNQRKGLSRWKVGNFLATRLRLPSVLIVIFSIAFSGFVLVFLISTYSGIKINSSKYFKLGFGTEPDYYEQNSKFPSLSSLTLIDRNGDCKKTMLYEFSNSYGLFSELLIYARFAAFGRSLGYTILIDDSHWIHGKLSDYFEIKYPDCSLNLNSSTIEREWFCDAAIKDINHVKIGRNCVWKLDSKIISVLEPDLLKLQAVWNFLNKRDDLTLLPVGQNLNFRLRSVFDSQASELLRIWKPNSQIKSLVLELENNLEASNVLNKLGSRGSKKRQKTVGLHFRLGDKVEEICENAFKNFVETPPAFGNPTRYIKMVLELAKDHHWFKSEQNSFFSKKSEIPINLVTISDDTDRALNLLTEYKKSFIKRPMINIIGLTKYRNSSTDHLPENGHNQTDFNLKPLSEKIKYNRELLSEVEYLVKKTDGIVCSMASNVCNALMLLSGSNKLIYDEKYKIKPLVRSVDHRWFPTSYPLYTEYNKNLKPAELFELGLKFSEDHRNHVDL
ncbi:hypothetical protein BY996DRAFT_7530074 [Phakopsora pachyrhizi]|uniref:Expressed protein n=1 Tax=Phakopsora pachyrhizi TaxID=170000 RepID=A0AAV0BED5_PHAPC|nr:hypothetical protein BY996DRAFT_7530074 [Phakopsora pachyrhizi]CAH7684950.1 expressed protein [Phakopsora pachyrhizi]